MSTRRFSRRSLLKAAALAPPAALLRGNPLGQPIGTQAWPVRQKLAADFPGTLREIAGMGFQTLEMCSPQGYERSGFGPLAKMKASELRAAIEAAGLRCESCHYGFRELKDNLDERIAFAKELGLKQMILATFGLRKEARLADWVEAANELNRIGERTRKAGLQLGFHNHNNEFEKIDGQIIYDKLLATFDPELVKLQFQVAVVSLGYHAADYLSRYPGRYLSLHLADWSETEKKPVAVGSGIVDWKKLFAAAKTAGVKNYFVEVAPEAMKPSVDYLRTLS